MNVKRQQEVAQSAAVIADANGMVEAGIGSDPIVVLAKHGPLHEHSQMNVVVDGEEIDISYIPAPCHLVRVRVVAYYLPRA